MALERPIVPDFLFEWSDDETWMEIQEVAYRNRVMFLFGTLDVEKTTSLMSLMTYLDLEIEDGDFGYGWQGPIQLLINCRGGLVNGGISLFDTMQRVASPVETVCVGSAGGVASLILCGGAKGHRSGFPSSKIWLKNPSIPVEKKQAKSHIPVWPKELVFSEKAQNSSPWKSYHPFSTNRTKLNSAFCFPNKQAELHRPFEPNLPSNPFKPTRTKPNSPLFFPKKEDTRKRREDFFLAKQRAKRGLTGGFLRAEELFHWRETMIKLYAERTGKAEAVIAKDLSRDLFLTADQASEYGILDRVAKGL